MQIDEKALDAAIEAFEDLWGQSINKQMETAIIAYLTATAQGRDEVPVGWKLVPNEMTADMVLAAHRQIDWCRNDQNTHRPYHPTQTKYGTTSCGEDIRDAWRDALAAAPLPPSQDGAREGEPALFIEEGALERLAKSAGAGLYSVARERRGDAMRKCTISLYTRPPAPDEAVRAAVEAEREAIQLLSDLLTGAQVHNDRYQDRRLEGPLWNKAATLVNKYRARSRSDGGAT